MRLSDLQTKTIVNIDNGKNIGTIIDVNVNSDGKIESLVIEYPKKVFAFSKDEDIVVYWDNINKIGDDVILVSLR